MPHGAGSESDYKSGHPNDKYEERTSGDNLLAARIAFRKRDKSLRLPIQRSGSLCNKMLKPPFNVQSGRTHSGLQRAGWNPGGGSSHPPARRGPVSSITLRNSGQGVHEQLLACLLHRREDLHKMYTGRIDVPVHTPAQHSGTTHGSPQISDASIGSIRCTENKKKILPQRYHVRVRS